MNPQLTLVQSNYGYALSFVLEDITGTVINLTNAALTFNCQSVSDPTVEFIGNMSITSPTLGTCQYVVQSGDFKVLGPYTAQVVANYSSGVEIITWTGINITVVGQLPQ